jgi:hypothetical protein
MKAMEQTSRVTKRREGRGHVTSLEEDLVGGKMHGPILVIA